MRVDDETALKKELCGRQVDFYLEDDMFEIEGAAACENGEIVIRALSTLEFVKKICGDSLKLRVRDKRVYAERTDTGKIFEMEINRIYENLETPSAEDFLRMKATGADWFLQKSTDTLVWFEQERDEWMIETNKINMCFNGVRTAYAGIEKLFEAHKEQMSGTWQAIFFSSSMEKEVEYGENCC